jgi:hypothetical protein
MRISGNKREEVAGGWRKLVTWSFINYELHQTPLM